MTTRLIVKSLPANCTEASLRSFFKKYGTLSDCTLKYTKEGKFRKFAFVGFDSEENAKKALKETDLSFMGSSRLHVEECKPFGDANKPRAWSQYSKDSRENEDGTQPSEPPKKKKIDPEYREFLEAQGVKETEIVTNDTSGAAFVTFNRPPDVRRVLQRNQEYIGGYRVRS
ncbi:unnamed protein product [Cylicostephanus goldi]|uniref:RRM domain-containing protein n=1 Tax=Cylicostephanus goldi TaxID=71465 RepID=A0A3P7PSG9_CYLGO|nr:unnamed protein product [Cylicostephanus goldi]